MRTRVYAKMTDDVVSTGVASENDDESYEVKWGLPLEEIYKVAVDQYKKGMWGPLRVHHVFFLV